MEFIVLEDIGHIEMRYKSGKFVFSICCINCVEDLEKAIKKLKRTVKKD